ncbi:MAG: hypothetical protein LBD24_00650 [Spirochaetaceae bacterium]|nr:hypothetical protein [Spirochaetaceae bacterium]
MHQFETTGGHAVPPAAGGGLHHYQATGGLFETAGGCGGCGVAFPVPQGLHSQSYVRYDRNTASFRFLSASLPRSQTFPRRSFFSYI